MADKKPLVTGVSPAVVRQIDDADALDVPEIKLGTPLGVAFGGLGADASGWANGKIPVYNGTVFAPGDAAGGGTAAGPSGAVQLSDGSGGFRSADGFTYTVITGTSDWLNVPGVVSSYDHGIWGESRWYGNSGPGAYPQAARYVVFGKLTEYVEDVFEPDSGGLPTYTRLHGDKFEASVPVEAPGIAYTDTAAVTQITSKSTAVTVNARKFTITMHNGSLAAGAAVSFVLNNSTIAGTDSVVLVTHASAGLGSYCVNAGATGAGTAQVTVRNVTTGALAHAIVLKGVVIN